MLVEITGLVGLGTEQTALWVEIFKGSVSPLSVTSSSVSVTGFATDDPGLSMSIKAIE